ncbi:MAG TPA: thioesterase family protein [Thermoplasmata archaeon]|nr:thioesterase family protein [Thermoplasmata archaeon]
MPKCILGWGDLDGNNHLANTAILNRAADARLSFFAEHGFPGSRFASEGLGPVVAGDVLEYRKESRLQEAFTIDLHLEGLSADGVRVAFRNVFRNEADGVTSIGTSEGVWFDLVTRRPRAHPPELDVIQRAIPRTESFHVLPARRR